MSDHLCELCHANPIYTIAAWTGWMFMCRQCAEQVRPTEPEVAL